MAELAGYNVRLRLPGEAVTLTDAATTEVDAQTFQITAATQRLLDPDTAITVEDDGSPVSSANIESIDLLTGKVTFISSYTVVGDVTISGAYLPLHTICYAKEFSVEMSRDVQMSTRFCNNGAPQRVTTLRDASGTIGSFGTGEENVGGKVFKDLFEGGTSVIIEFDAAGDQSRVWRFHAIIVDESTTASPESLVEHSLNWSLNAIESVDGYPVDFSLDALPEPAIPPGARYLFWANDVDGDNTFNAAYSDADPIGEWVNQGSEGPDNFISSGSNRPVLDLDGAPNSQPSLNFTAGSSHYMELENSASASKFLHNTLPTFHIVAVVRPTYSAARWNLLDTTDAGGSAEGLRVRIDDINETVEVRQHGNIQVERESTVTVFPSAAWAVMEVVSVAGAPRTSSDLDDPTESLGGSLNATSTNDAEGDLEIGRTGSTYVDGRYAFFAIWDRPLKQYERQKLAAWIESIYGL